MPETLWDVYLIVFKKMFTYREKIRYELDIFDLSILMIDILTHAFIAYYILQYFKNVNNSFIITIARMVVFASLVVFFLNCILTLMYGANT